MDESTNDAPADDGGTLESGPASTPSGARPASTRKRVVATSVVGAVVIAGAAFGGGVAVGSATSAGSTTQAQFGQGGPGSGTRPAGGPGGTSGTTGGASGTTGGTGGTTGGTTSG